VAVRAVHFVSSTAGATRAEGIEESCKPRGDKLSARMEEADPRLIDALRELTSELELLNQRVAELGQAIDELRGEMIIARGGGDAPATERLS
jgi:hypothetical protein